ncbi:MAG TPA: tetratricopeptide repeat protein [Gemmatimonadales bacterium]
MAYTSEIEKLEARFNDNPKGRNFAPLADAYRKAGLIDNAIVLCQNGLQLHPDYVSAYIVYARCLVDKKDDPAALGVFKKVLELDAQNIIALRGLAELAERNGNYAEEVQWLGQLLNADPMNGDAAEALARAKGKLATKPMEVSEAPTAAMDKPDFAVDHETPESVELKRDSVAATSAPEVENFESPISFNPNAHEAAKADGLEVQEDVELNSQQIEQVEVEGLARTQYEGSGMFKLDAPEPAGRAAAPDLDDGLPQVDLPLIMPDDEDAPRKAAAPPQPPAPPAPRVPPPAPPSPAPRVSMPAVVALSDDDGAADTATLSQAEPVLTETMAELYLRQGHSQDALRVYQALLAQRPGDAKLKSKVDQLSSGGRKGSGISAQAFLKGIWSGRRPTPEPGGAPEEQTTLEAAFDGAGPPPGEPSHPAQDHISLDSVFGEEARGSTAAPSPASEPSSPAAAAASPAPDASKTGGFSFDEFFAGGKGGAAGEAPADATAAKTPGGSRTSGRTQRPPEDDAEADQFQQWLKKLKS